MCNRHILQKGVVFVNPYHLCNIINESVYMPVYRQKLEKILLYNPDIKFVFLHESNKHVTTCTANLTVQDARTMFNTILDIYTKENIELTRALYKFIKYITNNCERLESEIITTSKDLLEEISLWLDVNNQYHNTFCYISATSIRDVKTCATYHIIDLNTNTMQFNTQSFDEYLELIKLYTTDMHTIDKTNRYLHPFFFWYEKSNTYKTVALAGYLHICRIMLEQIYGPEK